MKQEITPAARNEKNWSQVVTSSRKHRGKIYRPYAFTDQGVAMLSSVLKSERRWVAHASRVLVSASRRNELSFEALWFLNRDKSPQWRDAIANTRDACATQQLVLPSKRR